MKRSLLSALALAAGVAIAAPTTHASPRERQRENEIEKTAASADVVAFGQVTETKSRRHRNEHGDDLIVTDVKMKVREKLKGEANKGGDELRMTIEGGTLDGITLKVSDLPAVAPGDEMVVFLNESAEGLTPARRGFGVFQMDRGTNRVHDSKLTVAEIRTRVRNARAQGN